MAIVIDWRLRQISLSFARLWHVPTILLSVPRQGLLWLFIAVICAMCCAVPKANVIMAHMLAGISISHVVHNPRWNGAGLELEEEEEED